MLRRSILGISSRQRLVKRFPTRVASQIPLYHSSRKEFSAVSEPNSSKGSHSTNKSSGSILSKVVIGSLVFGAAGLTAYNTGYLDSFLIKEQDNDANSPVVHPVIEEPHHVPKVDQDGDHIAVPNFQESNISSSNVDHLEKNIETHSDLGVSEGKSEYPVQHVSETESRESSIPVQENVPDSQPQNSYSSDDGINNSTAAPEENLDMESQGVKPAMAQQEAVQTEPILAALDIGENLMQSAPPHPDIMNLQDVPSDGMKEPMPLLDAYLLRDKSEETVSSSGQKDIANAIKETDDVYVSNDGKLVLDLVQAIHTAEKRQAELDAQVFSEEKRLMKEKYEKELKDARARELMYAEREVILDKELNREKVKAAAALKSLQEKLKEELRMEIEKKEAEAELELKKLQDLAKAELAAAIASEKASQIEKMTEANLNINALCMAFYARSEEARQSHSVHKLALGALALDDALSKGLPIQKEVDALHGYLEGIDKDSLLGLVLASLPEETLRHGTDTILQLNHKFDCLKGTLRHFSLIPPGGGGILAHSLAYVASMLKVKETDQSGDGVESTINRVENLLTEGKLLEAADTLENGLKGSQAAEVIVDWVKQARNRAITEQALTLLQSYATSVSLT